MPPLRLLPPRFLLPAWTAPQVQYAQRAYKSERVNKWPTKKRPYEADQESVEEENRPLNQSQSVNTDSTLRGRWFKSHRALQLEQPSDTNPERQGLSLFEELFPEENRVVNQKAKRNEIRDSGFPSIEDLNKVSESFPRTREKGSWRKALNVASSRSWSEFSSYQDPLESDHVAVPMRRYDLQDHRIRREATVLVVSNAAPSLSESDFLRISPKGQHIKSWNSGIIKVIPGRDPQTLEPQGHYFILFSTDAAAQAYRTQLVRLHHILRTHSKDSITPSLPPPPGFVKDGDDIHAIMQAYTIIPASQRAVTARILTRPYSLSVQRLISNGGYPEIATTTGVIMENKVLFSLDKGFPTVQAIRLLLRKDQKERNLPWKLAGNDSDIVWLGKSKGARLVDDDGEDIVEDYHDSKNHRTQHTKWILTFQDSQEARRFVRTWHQRDIEALQYHSPDGEPSPRAMAELLW